MGRYRPIRLAHLPVEGYEAKAPRTTKRAVQYGYYVPAGTAFAPAFPPAFAPVFPNINTARMAVPMMALNSMGSNCYSVDTIMQNNRMYVQLYARASQSEQDPQFQYFSPANNNRG